MRETLWYPTEPIDLSAVPRKADAEPKAVREAIRPKTVRCIRVGKNGERAESMEAIEDLL